MQYVWENSQHMLTFSTELALQSKEDVHRRNDHKYSNSVLLFFFFFFFFYYYYYYYYYYYFFFFFFSALYALRLKIEMVNSCFFSLNNYVNKL
jgi:hypothetical protein